MEQRIIFVYKTGNKRKNIQSSDYIGDKGSDSKCLQTRGPSEDTELLLASHILNEPNNVLYGNEDKHDLDIIFSNMSDCRKKCEPTNADILAYLEKINGRLGNVERSLGSLTVLEKNNKQ